jgi:hypothetical protein
MTEEILHRPPRPLRQIDDSISADLEHVCLRCLSRATVERFATARDLRDGLSPKPAIQSRKPRQRRSLVLAGLAVCALVAMAAALIAWNAQQSPANIKSPEVVAWSPYDQHDSFGFDEQDKSFRFDAFGHAAFSVESLTHEEVDISMTFSQRRWVGLAGIFWDLRRDPNGGLRCRAVEVGRHRQDLPFNISLCEFMIGPTGNGRRGVQTSTCTLAIPSDVPAEARATLRIQAKHSECIQIWLDGQPQLPAPYQFAGNEQPVHGAESVGFFGKGGEVSVFDFVVK